MRYKITSVSYGLLTLKPLYKKLTTFLLYAIFTSSFFYLPSHAMWNSPKKTQKIKSFLEELYQPINGYTLTKGESEHIKDLGGAPTYGEITFDSADYLFGELKLNSNDVFYDLGSGVGKTVLQAFLTTPFKKSVGVELSHTRHTYASTMLNKLLKEELRTQNRILEYREGNFLDTDFSDATIIYMCSVCYPDELMRAITNKIIALPAGVRIASFKRMPDHERLVLQQVYRVPANWHPRALIYLYQLI